MRLSHILPINSLELDRLPVNPKTLELVRHLEKGGGVPPIHVRLGMWGQWRVLDGRHRVAAFKLLGRTEIVVRYGTYEEGPSIESTTSPSTQTDRWPSLA